MNRERTRSAACLALVVCLLSVVHGQDSDPLDLVLNRLGLYLLEYEGELSTVVASERYDQQEIRPARRTGRTASTITEIVRSRRLESDVAFLRLPGGSSWLGVRDVLTVDGKPVTTDTARLLALVKRFGRESDLDEAARITAASSVHNLGSVRTINMPTTPLELLHPDHHVQYVFKLRGTDKIDGVTTTRLDFEEFDEPTIVGNPEGDPLFIRGTAWVEPENGRLWRAQFVVRPKSSRTLPRNFQSRLRVDYMLHAELKMLVPKQMSEDFFVIGGRGVGQAKYSNYRRFSTAGRVVPQ
jgi:hypothetical protein